jgi:heme-degrading monooxygenase HmoA
MFVRITRVETAPDHLDQAVKIWQQQVLPTARQQDGFRGATVLADRTSGIGTSITYWVDEAALRATDAGADARRAEISQATGSRVLEVDRFELVIWERSAQPKANTFVRVNDIQGLPAKIDDGIRFVREQVVPAVAKLKGYRAAIMGVNRASGRVFMTSVWETAADREGSDAGLAELRRQGAQALGAEQVKVEQLETLFVEINVPAAVGSS